MQIEFDTEKRDKTLTERGLDFARAGEVFLSPSVTLTDERQDYGEPRLNTVGFLDGRMVVLAWTQRGAARRIISMRKANEREQKRFGSLD
ncbi:MAG: BrnT family toxin [Burkholderiaceae bacterium]|nr:BrnT family toxin [Burkholderiaceae bacterium]